MVNDVSEVGKFERIKAVSFLGYADAQEGDELFESAKETARMMAEHGVINVNGGGPGVMRAATEGAHEGGGKRMWLLFTLSILRHLRARTQ
ncbi:hypothetical protein KKA49_02450 [Patescibacteria group bacterium]|nr:hypothetical protein [Patescibacteria group bacterium]MBU1457214.1 hypothetical protein [Patescibacteria group bacterium]